tara:strand:+ start:14391 stop:14921 length:531 start_codon:yes stop_codon:yes gene_type:complete
MKKLTSIILLTSLISLSGCSTKPTFADRVLAEGESRIDIATQWEGGKKLATTGAKQLKNGQKVLDKGLSDLNDGQQLVTLGNLEIEKNKLIFQTLSKQTIAITASKVALETATKLKNSAQAWQDGEEKVTKGNKLVQLGKANITKGDAEVQKGQALLTSGQKQMQDAESRYESSPQ